MTLPQLKVLDGIEITRSNRLLAQKTYDETRKRITQSIAEYRITRDEQKVRVQKQSDADELNNKDLSEDDKIKKYKECFMSEVRQVNHLFFIDFGKQKVRTVQRLVLRWPKFKRKHETLITITILLIRRQIIKKKKEN